MLNKCIANQLLELVYSNICSLKIYKLVALGFKLFFCFFHTCTSYLFEMTANTGF